MTTVTVALLMDRQLRKKTIWFGLFLIGIGLVGIVLPQVIGVTMAWLLAILLILAGAITAYLTWLNYYRSGLAWLKPFSLIMLGLLILFHPAAGAAALGLLLIVYFLLDGFAGISFGLALRPVRGWVWTLINGIISLLLAGVFLATWPVGSVWLVGLLVGISLIIDGAAILGLALAADPGS